MIMEFYFVMVMNAMNFSSFDRGLKFILRGYVLQFLSKH